VSLAIVTGSGGLIGSETCRFLLDKGWDVCGIDNDKRAYFFGESGSTKEIQDELCKIKGYSHYNIDICDDDLIDRLFQKSGRDINLVVHTAAQPAHDWAVREPKTDFDVNARGTLNMVDATKRFCPNAVFIYTSTSKVYGDNPNRIGFEKFGKRWDLPEKHEFWHGIPESFSIDHNLHSLFGASKTAGDLIVQEYGRYFGMNTVCFRGGCLTGPHHKGVELHGFLSYLVKCIKTGQPYTIFGYDGMQVRDNIHSYDLVKAFWEFFLSPREGAVYNIGGGRHSNCSILEAVDMIESNLHKKANIEYNMYSRIGDHIWYISDTRKFQWDYPNWKYDFTIEEIIERMCNS
jgi:CDP-paratose 2-epimerase